MRAGLPSDVHSHTIAATRGDERHARWRDQLANQLPARAWRTRFAPAPTGYLHLGHLVNAIYVWGIARAYGGEVVLRIEDHDRTRCHSDYEAALLDDLTWLGLEADVAPIASYRANDTTHAHRQSNNAARYVAALTQLDEQSLVYPCACTRREIAARVPHGPGEEPRYPGTCRDGHVNAEATYARRVRLDEREEHFTDLRLGAITQRPAMQCGDLLARDRAGLWTYQFAVVVDDAAHGIDVIIRGEDLLASTGRQRQLARLLGRTTHPMVLHHPLLVHRDGAKLSKATHDTSLRARRQAGATAEQLLGEAAHLAGLTASPQPIEAAELAALFRATERPAGS